MEHRNIPVVDLNQFINGNIEERNAFVQNLGTAFHDVGFAGIVNHGIPKKLIEDFYAGAKAFFSLPSEVKRKYEDPHLAGQRGYTSFGKEHAKHSKVGDLKEFYQLGQTVEDSSDPDLNTLPI